MRTHDDIEEEKAVGQVIDRLAARYPQLPYAHIGDVVRSELRVFDGRPIRTYVPVLVEHEARALLRRETSGHTAG
ncbi:three-helix bundle dimerization domain-containing protein [Luethyella okanaganae]|uniref:Three-helix bundle dimerization domain-containing protein n=1 Tax=Luethyella okanaganae TaxID=69372 RepID=A0ABW1VC81_9MICO